MVATRLRDTAFKRVLSSVPLGTEMKIEGPFGNLRLHNDKSRAVVVFDRWDRHNHVLQYSFAGCQGEVAAPHIPLLREPTSRRCRVP